MGANCCAGGESTSASQPGKSGNKHQTNDDKIRQAVKTVFQKYDKDQSGLLDKEQVYIVINAALKQMEGGRTATKEQVDKLITRSDLNKDGKINQEQLFKLFKTVAN